MWQHVFKSGKAIIRAYIMYKPYVVFATLGFTLLALGIIPFARYLILLLANDHGDHLQSLLLGSILLIGSFLSFALGVISDLIRTNRIMHEDALERLKEMQFRK
jgi:hypothetical protein